MLHDFIYILAIFSPYVEVSFRCSLIWHHRFDTKQLSLPCMDWKGYFSILDDIMSNLYKQIRRIVDPGQQQIWLWNGSKVKVSAWLCDVSQGSCMPDINARVIHTSEDMSRVKTFVREGRTERRTDEWILIWTKNSEVFWHNVALIGSFAIRTRIYWCL